MSGQSAHLTLKEARAMQKCIQHSGSHEHNHGGGAKDSGHRSEHGDAMKAPAHHQHGKK
jgi:hypothetical protein